ncbi:MAG: YggS family pyridoxal phosphate-dependent enzyme [Spongiibacteraceae bacterium]
MIESNLTAVRQRIVRAAAACGRDPAAIRLLAVSKTRPVEDVLMAYAAGCRDFGENYVQEGEQKILASAGLKADWHFIGPIQSNKTRVIAEHFHWVHSVDRLKIAQRLSEQRGEGKAPLQLCVQVNISNEESKGGVAVAELPALVAGIMALPRLQLRGLMAIPAPTTAVAVQRAAFAAVRGAFSELRQSWPQLDTLSMGMSAYLEAAIDEGATIVRVGTDIFGARP